ncbi:MAG TPA: ABC transporter ATP-binding protein [Actinospica sp.]|nr:ABC transporter ATP-binding protein [Actinospica sp.]
MIALEAFDLGRQYGRRVALDGCEFQLPVGRVCALVGANGAGKSTLLTLAAGLLTPSCGHIAVFGARAGAQAVRPLVGFLPQDRPLFPQLSVEEHLRLGHELNPRWNRSVAEQALGDLPREARVETLSGGQRARLALTLVLGKQPDLLLLDEPMAQLDPLARHELTSAIMADAAERGTTVVISSHSLAEIEPVCDHLLLMDAGRVLLAGDTEELIGCHTMVTAAVDEGCDAPRELGLHSVVDLRASERSVTALIRPGALLPGEWITATPSLEEVVLGYMRNPSTTPLLTEPDSRPKADLR